ncbi:hypothetical protein ACLEPN_00245 [Myxococcus sp. 1LA]
MKVGGRLWTGEDTDHFCETPPDAAWMPVVVSLEHLVYALSVQGRLLETLRENLCADILRRGYTFEQLKQRLVGLGDRPVAPLEDAELRLAIIARELERAPELPGAVATLERAVEAWTRN